MDRRSLAIRALCLRDWFVVQKLSPDPIKVVLVLVGPLSGLAWAACVMNLRRALSAGGHPQSLDRQSKEGIVIGRNPGFRSRWHQQHNGFQPSTTAASSIWPPMESVAQTDNVHAFSGQLGSAAWTCDRKNSAYRSGCGNLFHFRSAHGFRMNELFIRRSREDAPTSTSNWPGSVTQSFFVVL
jgi:hypothetical protein